ncbi:MAG: 3-hydroxyacyl-CoA dehydrogenase NAD-binding domain-containing protein, partial [Candidatus Competibacteraceae bacterium]|nr:3-hydroxyacyl-CoA dehydrogenase NAD-binding domain-containing protein [Candidatus Competibacteraceae bacterium]
MNPGALSLEVRAPGVAVVTIDDPRESVNTLRRSMIAEFDRLLSTLEERDDLQCLVLASGKPQGFIAGADLEMLQELTTALEAQELAEVFQGLQGRIQALSIPTVAAIHGSCLGGGLELTLALDGRVAAEDARLGLPEVQLGLLPGGGGTQRLPRLVGLDRALELLLTGRQLDARRAAGIGLVDEVVPRPLLLEAAIRRALELGQGHRAPSRWIQLRRRLLAGPGRKLVLGRAWRQTRARTRSLYPAPERILTVVETGLVRGLEAGLAAEAQAFGELAVSPQADRLIELFFAANALKTEPWVEAKPSPVAKVGVLGGGLMGAGIALVTAHRAARVVRLKDRDHQGVGHGLAHIHRQLTGRVSRRRMTPLERDQVLARVSGTIDYSGFTQVDLVIEAVFEDLALKRQMIREVEAVGAENMIFASNTSALPIDAIAQASRHPETVVGMHYFSPVERMPLLEVVAAPRTAPWVIATCVALGRAQGKTVIVVNDGPGFYSSRILAPYLNEAARLVAEGIAVETVDRALLDFGLPVGPLALLDEVGLDVGAKVAATLEEAFGERMQPPEAMARLLEERRLGRKAGRGFYHYGRGKGKVDDSVYKLINATPGTAPPAQQLAQRCILLMVNEAIRCFEEGILGSARDGDVGAVF